MVDQLHEAVKETERMHMVTENSREAEKQSKIALENVMAQMRAL